MRIYVRLTPGSKQENIEKTVDLLGNERYAVRVKALPVDGKANVALINILAKYFGVIKRDITIVQGKKSRDKVIDILHISLDK